MSNQVHPSSVLAPWRSPLAGALHRNRSLPYARYAQLATVRPDGRPANRTIVFRGFLEGTNQLKFVTDDRSEKPQQIEHTPAGELCWYFPTTREQFRLGGTLTLVRAIQDSPLQQARISAWHELSDAARIQFAWPHPREARAGDEAFQPETPDALTPLTHFCLLLLDPDRVDHLELRGNPQNRYLYLRNDRQEWEMTEVNP